MDNPGEIRSGGYFGGSADSGADVLSGTLLVPSRNDTPFDDLAEQQLSIVGQLGDSDPGVYSHVMRESRHHQSMDIETESRRARARVG